MFTMIFLSLLILSLAKEDDIPRHWRANASISIEGGGWLGVKDNKLFLSPVEVFLNISRGKYDPPRWLILDDFTDRATGFKITSDGNLWMNPITGGFDQVFNVNGELATIADKEILFAFFKSIRSDDIITATAVKVAKTNTIFAMEQ